MSSSSQEDSELSSLELRSKLFHSFQSKGVLQSVKSQLRNRLAFELQGRASASAAQLGKAQNECSLFQQFSNNLVLNHLKESKYDYALSVFITESLTNPDKSFDAKEMLHMLHINPESQLYKDVVKQYQDTYSKESFLYKFLQLLSLHKSHGSTNMSTQTDDDHHGVQLSLDAKLKEVELSLKKKLNDRDSDSLETKLLSFQRKYEAQKKTELKVEIERFKSSQLSMLKIEEQEKYQKEVKKIKEMYDENYRKHMADFEKKDRDWQEKCDRQKQAIEKEAYEKRQKLLSDLQQLKDREIQLDKNNELTIKSISVEEENLKSRREQLRYKEETLRDVEKRYEERLQSEIIKMKYEMQMEGKHELEKIHSQEQQLREDKINFEAQKEIYIQWKKEAEKLKSQSEEQHMALLTSKETINTMNHKIGTLTERCKKIINYDEVLNLNKLLEKDMALLQKNFDNLHMEKAQREKEHQKLVKDLTKRASRSKEMETAKDKEGYFREKYYAMQDQYQVEMTKNDELKKINEDLLLSQRETLREVDELSSALQLAKQEKERMRRTPAPKIPHARGLTSSLKSPKAPPNIKRKPWSEDDIINHHHSNIVSPVEDNVDMLAKLEREAKELERSYNDFKERQKNDVKSTSRVHFDPLVQRRSTSTVNNSSVATDFTRTLEIRLDDDGDDDGDENTAYGYSRRPPINAFPAYTGRSVQAASSSTTTTYGTLLPLSSTQTAPGVGGNDQAPSFGLSLVPEPSHVRSSITSPVAYRGDESLPKQQQRPPTATTCHSLTQHPLADATENQTGGNQSNYTLYDTRNTLTQYPLGDTELNTVVENPAEEDREEVGREHSSISDVSTFKTTNQSVTNRKTTNSVESELQLKETSIETFESPDKKVEEGLTQHNDDIFYTPAKRVTIGLEEDESAPSSARSKSGAGGKSSIGSSSRDDGSMRETELRTDSLSEETSVKSFAGKNHGEVEEIEEEEVDEELEEVDESKKEEENEEEDHMMTTYMQMVLQKKQNEKEGTEVQEENNKTGPVSSTDEVLAKTNSDKQFDIPLSEDDNSAVKDDSISSEYEW